jgi:endonuclease YncB( thermonuclease family)
VNRISVMAGAVVALLGLCAVIVAGGRSLTPPPVQLDEISDADMGLPESAPADVAFGDDKPSPTENPPAEAPSVDPQNTTVPSRLIAPAEVAPPPPELERLPPREPLSPLAQAKPPKPVMPDEWKGTTLFQPVATAAGAITAKGYSIVLEGIDPIAPDETCEANGASWPCGARARAAFRAMLRGRAVTCTIPPEAERAAIVAPCRVGKVDLGQWLVDNGWARARDGGPYADAGSAAKEGGKGIFGTAPKTDVPAPSVTGSTLAAPQPADSGTLLAPDAAAPAPADPAVPPVTEGLAFPPAPIAPASPPAP